MHLTGWMDGHIVLANHSVGYIANHRVGHVAMGDNLTIYQVGQG